MNNSKSLNRMETIFLIGIIFTILGSFSPWREQGDFISYWTYGIRLFPRIEDNGGLLIVILSILQIVIKHLQDNISKRIFWSITIGVFLLLISIYHIMVLIMDRHKASGIIGAPIISIGLIMILIGSSVQLFISTKLRVDESHK
jgi:hypothetical protein